MGKTRIACQGNCMLRARLLGLWALPVDCVSNDCEYILMCGSVKSKAGCCILKAFSTRILLNLRLESHEFWDHHPNQSGRIWFISLCHNHYKDPDNTRFFMLVKVNLGAVTKLPSCFSHFIAAPYAVSGIIWAMLLFDKGLVRLKGPLMRFGSSMAWRCSTQPEGGTLDRKSEAPAYFQGSNWYCL